MIRKKLIFIVWGAVGLALVVIGIRATTVEASGIPGTGTLSGEVDAPVSFKAAQIHAMNVDLNVLYMVYTAGGRYRMVNMLPGHYEVSVNKRGFTGDVRNVVIEPGTTATASFSLQEAPLEAIQAGSFGFRGAAKDAELLPYDTVYPPGPGREVLERTCILCHGINFPPKLKGPDAFWNEIIDKPGMMGLISADDRKVLVDYLVENYGPDSTPRAVAVGVEMPLDEQALAKAMYIEYYLPLDPELDAGITQRRTYEPHFDHDGNVWYTDTSVPNRIGKVDPRTGLFEDFLLADPGGSPHGITVDADGHVWWAETRGFHLGRLNPGTGEMIRYPMDPRDEIPGGQGHTPIVGSQENIWFTVIRGNRLGKWDRKSEEITLWEPPTPRSFPYGIVQDKTDNIWFLQFHGCHLTKFDPRTEAMTEYSVLSEPKPLCTPRRLGIAPNGKIWFAVSSDGLVSEFDPDTGTVIEHPLPIPLPYAEPHATQPDHMGNIWISDAGQGGALIRLDPTTETFTYYPSPLRTDMPELEVTREGAVWYSPRGSEKGAVGVLYPDKDEMTTMAAYY